MIWDFEPVLFGPTPVPWHGIFLGIEVLIGIYLLVSRIRGTGPTVDQVSWLLIVFAAHAAYTVFFSGSTPDFNLEIRWYGVTFAVGLMLAARVLPTYFEERGLPREHADSLTLLMPIGMIVGAHLVHLVFYEPDSFWTNPRRIIEIGSGLASHGGGLGAALVVVWFALRQKGDPWVYLDASMCVAAWVIPWVRIGNFFNSEIVGAPWDGPWAITFPRHDCPGYPDIGPVCEDAVARHPSQLYEAVIGFLIVILAVYLQKKWRKRLLPGATFALLLGVYFVARILVEFFKDYQVADVAQQGFLTMGQWLSVPIVLFCVWVLFLSKNHNILTVLPEPEEGDDDPAPAKPPVAASTGSGGDDSPSTKPRRPRKKKKRR